MKNNKGFSLVELIIVIAIMAILVGVIAPQLILYIEKSRVAADTQYCDSIREAITIACSDIAVINDPASQAAIKWYTSFPDAGGANYWVKEFAYGYTSADTAFGRTVRDIMGWKVGDQAEVLSGIKSKARQHSCDMGIMASKSNTLYIYIANSDRQCNGNFTSNPENCICSPVWKEESFAQ